MEPKFLIIVPNGTIAQKNLIFCMDTTLFDFITSYRNSTSAETEDFVISTELARIRSCLNASNAVNLPRIVAKLIFLDLIGINTSFAHVQIINLMNNQYFSYKRIGYLAAELLFDENNDIYVLVTHTISKDLKSVDPHIQCLALGFIANVASGEMCKQLASDVKKCTDSNNTRVLKYTGMAMLKIVRKNPELANTFKNSVQKLLNHNSHGVIISGMNFVIEILTVCKNMADVWSQFFSPFIKILNNLMNKRGVEMSTKNNLFSDPFMGIKVLKALELLKKTNENLENLLQSIVSQIEVKMNTGRAILYQIVDTILSVSTNPSLRGLTFNQIGRLLSIRNPDILYFSLSSFTRILYKSNGVINRGGADSMALQRYKTRIVSCLKCNDPSIRRRALDVISALIDEQNITSLVPEILEYLHLSDSDFCTELINKIYPAVQRFSKDKKWNFDIMHNILINSGSCVSSDIIGSFCESVLETPEIHEYAVETLSKAIEININNQKLIQVGSYILGEISNNKIDVISCMKQIIFLPQTTTETILYIIFALSKISSRIGMNLEISQFLQKLTTSNELEVQQRAGEMMNLLKSDICSYVLAPSTDDLQNYSEEKSAKITQTNNEKDVLDDDLLSFVMNDKGDQQNNNKHSNYLDDLLGLNLKEKVVQEITPPPNSTELFNNNHIVIFSQTQTNPQDPNQIAKRLLIYNKCSTQITNFMIFHQLPTEYLIIEKPDLKTNCVTISNAKPLEQILYIKRTASIRFEMKTSVRYNVNGQDFTVNFISN